MECPMRVDARVYETAAVAFQEPYTDAHSNHSPDRAAMELHEIRNADDADIWAREFIARVIVACPRRQPTSDDERRAQELVREQYDALGLTTEHQRFTFNNNLYANLLLHFGVGVLGSAVALTSPALGLALHSVAGISYVADSTRRAFILRRLFPFRESLNTLATLPSIGERRLRIVLVSHVDAAFTGMLFQPWFVKRFGAQPGPMYKSMRVATLSLGALALLDAWELGAGPSTLSRVLRVGLTLPSLIAAALNLDIVLRNQIVPGANDNLSGVAGGLALARLLRERRPEGVEFVFVTAGCEEASLGGSDALARRMKDEWKRDDTVILAIDGFSNGTMHWFHEGEVLPIAPCGWLESVLNDMRRDPRWAELQSLDIPVGGTDAVPFAIRGYDAVGIGCVDSALKAPRHYHLPTDTADALDVGKIGWCVSFCLDLIDRVARSHPRSGIAG